MDEEDTTWNGAKEMFSRMCGRLETHLPSGIYNEEGMGDHIAHCYLENVPISLILGERRAGLEEFLAALSWKDTEDQDDKGDGCQHNPQVGHSQVLGGGGPMVGKNTVQADKQQPGREGHTSSDVMQRLSMIHLGSERC